MTTLLLALTLAAGLAPAEPAPEREPGPPAPAVEPAATPPEQSGAAKSPAVTVLKGIGGVLAMEGVLAGMSYLGSLGPYWNWCLLLSSPIVGGMMYEDGGSLGIAWASGLTIAGISAFNLIELRKDRYSQKDRFWRNFAAWNAGAAVIAVAGLVDPRRKAPASSTWWSVSLGPTSGGVALLAAGRF